MLPVLEVAIDQSRQFGFYQLLQQLVKSSKPLTGGLGQYWRAIIDRSRRRGEPSKPQPSFERKAGLASRMSPLGEPQTGGHWEDWGGGELCLASARDTEWQGPGPVQSHLSPSSPLFAMTRLAIEITLCRMFMEHIFHSVSKYRSPMPAPASG